MFKWLKKKELVLVSKMRMDDDKFMMGFIPNVVGEEIWYDRKAEKKEIKIVTDIDYEIEKPIPLEKLKEVKKCKHEKSITEYVPMRFEQKREITYCAECGKVLSTETIKSKYTDKLIELRFAEGHMQEAKKNVQSLEGQLERAIEKKKKKQLEYEALKDALEREMNQNE